MLLVFYFGFIPVAKDSCYGSHKAMWLALMILTHVAFCCEYAMTWGPCKLNRFEAEIPEPAQRVSTQESRRTTSSSLEYDEENLSFRAYLYIKNKFTYD